MAKLPQFSLADLPHRFREQWLELGSAAQTWAADWRADPWQFLTNPLTRLLGWIVGGVLLLAVLGWGVGTLGQIEDGESRQATPTGTIRVACVAADCDYRAVTQVPIAFDDWPMQCPACQQESVFRARKCEECGGWHAYRPDEPIVCKRPAEEPPEPEVPTNPPPSTDPDDARDWW